MTNRNNATYLGKMIELIYTKHQNLFPFLNIFRKDIETLKFTPMGDDATAVIFLKEKKFHIIFNTDYIKRDNLTDEDILWTLCHEISHYILGHLTSEYEKKYSLFFRNFGYDCQVNSLLYNINRRKEINSLKGPNWENYGAFLKGEEEIPFFLLVPPPISKTKAKLDFAKSKLEKEQQEIILEFWFNNYSEEGLGLDEIFSYLENIIHVEDDQPVEENEKLLSEEELPESVIDFFKEINSRALNEQLIKSILEGENSKLFIDFDDVKLQKRRLNTLRSAIRESLFDSSENNSKMNEIQKNISVLPNISRKEALSVSGNYLPLYYSNRQFISKNKSSAIYIDFSYSTKAFHAEIAKLLSALKNEYKGKYYAFTTGIVEMTFKEITSGEYFSGGTDINPVYEHINQNRFEKALIITDGEFSVPSITAKAQIYAVLLGEDSSKNNFGKQPKKIWVING